MPTLSWSCCHGTCVTSSRMCLVGSWSHSVVCICCFNTFQGLWESVTDCCVGKPGAAKILHLVRRPRKALLHFWCLIISMIAPYGSCPPIPCPCTSEPLSPLGRANPAKWVLMTGWAPTSLFPTYTKARISYCVCQGKSTGLGGGH